MWSEKKGTDQLCRYREADLHLCFHICKHLVLNDAAHIYLRCPDIHDVSVVIEAGIIVDLL